MRALVAGMIVSAVSLCATAAVAAEQARTEADTQTQTASTATATAATVKAEETRQDVTYIHHRNPFWQINPNDGESDGSGR